jgi:Tfp pilus assembly protein PilF
VCVHDWTLDGLNYDINATLYWLAVDCVSGHVSNTHWSDLSALKYRRCNPYAERLLHDRFQEVVSRHTLSRRESEKLGKITDLLTEQVQYKAAERIYLQVLAGKEKALGPDHTSTLETVHNLGVLYWKQGKLAEAERMYQRALAGYEKALGPDHTSTLEVVNNLGSLYRDQGKSSRAGHS